MRTGFDNNYSNKKNPFLQKNGITSKVKMEAQYSMEELHQVHVTKPIRTTTQKENMMTNT